MTSVRRSPVKMAVSAGTWRTATPAAAKEPTASRIIKILLVLRIRICPMYLLELWSVSDFVTLIQIRQVYKENCHQQVYKNISA